MKQSNIKATIQHYFFVHPTAKMRVRQIERELKLPLPSVIRYCRELDLEKFLKKEAIAGVSLYSADRTSTRFLFEKKMFNIRSLYHCKLVDYLLQELSNPLIILFGSYARGEDIEKSDIDLYVQFPSRKRLSLERFEKLLDRKIQLFISSSLQDLKNYHLMNNIINGFIVNGFLEVFHERSVVG